MSSSSSQLSFFAQWFGIALILLGIGIEFVFVVISDLLAFHILLGFGELELELVGLVLIIFGLVLDLNYNHL